MEQLFITSILQLLPAIHFWNHVEKRCLHLFASSTAAPEVPVYQERWDRGRLGSLPGELWLFVLCQSNPAVNIKHTSPKALGAILTCGERYRSGLGETRWRHYCPLIVPASLLTSAMKTGATMQRRWDNQGRSTKNYKYSGTTETPKTTKKRGTGKAYAYV